MLISSFNLESRALLLFQKFISLTIIPKTIFFPCTWNTSFRNLLQLLEEGKKSCACGKGCLFSISSVARLSNCIAGSQKEDKFFCGGTRQGSGFVCSSARWILPALAAAAVWSSIKAASWTWPHPWVVSLLPTNIWAVALKQDSFHWLLLGPGLLCWDRRAFCLSSQKDTKSIRWNLGSYTRLE